MRKKNMNFSELLNKSEISLFGDIDKDKVPNVFDCKPLDPDRDGLFGRAINLLSIGRYGQSKEEYEAEKISKIHFERDPASGKVIRVTENGQEVTPSQKSVDQLLREYQKEQYISQLQKQKAANVLIKQKIELQKLKAKKQQLLLTQKLRSQRYPQPSAAREAASFIFGVPGPSGSGLQRPGYYIESTGPRLPKGFRWKKIPKGEKKGSKTTPRNLVCPRCGLPLMIMPGMFGQPMLVCPRCGAT